MILNAPLRRHIPFYIAASGGLAALAVALIVADRLATTIGANVFFAAYILLVLFEMPLLTADYLRKNAQRTDLPVQIIFVVTIAVIGVAVFCLFQIINAKQSPHPFGLVFSMISIPLGWFTIHLMSALHYAHLFWVPDDRSPKARGKATQPHGGLDFPGEKTPGGWDFLYFSTVIGMTAQTADTSITTTSMRRAVLVHSIVSFFFNTVIVAAAVNLAVSLGN